MELDHIAIAGASLEEATAHVEDALGVRLQAGGQHETFGTYNRLLGLEDGLYLEAIAIDPEAPNPGRPRWFDLDNFSGPPRLTNWICSVADLGVTLQSWSAEAGQIVDLARGELRWRMAVPETGQLPYDNLFPALIQWQGDLHPAEMLNPSGCRLQRLSVSHPMADDLARVLGPMKRVEFHTGPIALQAEFDTPSGPRVLE
ncbi:VOC family protein [Rhodobacteraceae bacterium B1Z28]|uniref:VOC family protein n=1 Tax=Ruegeria haliotis TaxID=2747601 RepID=A0ABX2PK93_9RHOB|nr:VOC family protein [Ruegeria haliotis]NVO54519.1 VOC family protein [Ruegeria haliotis]